MKTKKLFLSMFAMASMLFATSCSQNEVLDEPTTDGFVDATFTIGAADGIGSRAGELTIGKGLKADKVACAVYDKYGTELSNLRQYVIVQNGTPRTATYNVRLAKGQDYRVAFFAYTSNSSSSAVGQSDYYNLNDLKSIKINDANSNIEDRDAFTNYADIKAADLTNMSTYKDTVVLKRPFAQLNLGIDQTEYTDASNAGVVVNKSKIIVSSVYNAFNAYDNVIATDATLGSMTFEMNTIPTEKLEVNGQEYTYLALNYLLVGETGTEKSLTDVEFVWENADATKTNNPSTHFINIPVQRNYRTNIIGKLLTTPSEFRIEIDAEFDGDKVENIQTMVEKTVTTVDELVAAVNSAPVGLTTIKFANDIITDDLLTFNQAKDVQILIDGQNYTFNGQIYIDGKNNWNGTEALTIQNVKFDFTGSDDNDNAIIRAGKRNGGNPYAHNVTIKDCTFKANSSDIVALRSYQSFDFSIFNCDADNTLHSFAQISGGHDFEIDGLNINCVRGISLGSATKCVVRNSSITTTGDKKYGIRHSADSGTDVLKIVNCNINAYVPVVVRHSNDTPVADYKLVFEGTNNLTKQDDSELHVSVAEQEYPDVAVSALTSLSNVTVTGNDISWSIFK